MNWALFFGCRSFASHTDPIDLILTGTVGRSAAKLSQLGKPEKQILDTFRYIYIIMYLTLYTCTHVYIYNIYNIYIYIYGYQICEDRIPGKVRWRHAWQELPRPMAPYYSQELGHFARGLCRKCVQILKSFRACMIDIIYIYTWCISIYMTCVYIYIHIIYKHDIYT